LEKPDKFFAEPKNSLSVTVFTLPPSTIASSLGHAGPVQALDRLTAFDDDSFSSAPCTSAMARIFSAWLRAKSRAPPAYL